MTPEYVPAVSALAGSMIGGVTSLTAAWLTQSRQATIQWLVQDKSRRQKLYKEFIEEASKLYADALAHNEAEVSAFVKVYALISRTRVPSSVAIVEKAEKVVRMIIDTYFAPNKTLPELRGMLNSPAIDPLREFGESCRNEIQVQNSRARDAQKDHSI
jgi:hypothetical protein